MREYFCCRFHQAPFSRSRPNLLSLVLSIGSFSADLLARSTIRLFLIFYRRAELFLGLERFLAVASTARTFLRPRISLAVIFSSLWLERRKKAFSFGETGIDISSGLPKDVVDAGSTKTTLYFNYEMNFCLFRIACRCTTLSRIIRKLERNIPEKLSTLRFSDKQKFLFASNNIRAKVALHRKK